MDVPAFKDTVLGDCANRSDVWGRYVAVPVCGVRYTT